MSDTTLRGRALRWLFRLRSDEPAPVTLNYRRVFVLPTRAGLFWGVGVLVMLVGAINYSLGAAYLFVFLLAGVGNAAILHTFRNLVDLELSALHNEPVFAGQVAHLRVALHNRRADARHGLRLAFENGAAVSVDVPAGDTTALALPLPAPSRGWLAAGRITIETNFPVGLVRAWSYAHPRNLRVLVYPQPEHPAPPLPDVRTSGDSSGNARSTRAGDDFAGLRPWRRGDTPRQMAWKAVARGSSPVSKLFESSGTAQLWLDWHTLPARLDTEARLSRLARWCLDANAAGRDYGLVLPAVEIEPGSGPQHLDRCLRALALYGQDPSA
ncbi:MAG: DUF58 domain-containing protein [Rhodocyclaceae bacterium]|nr:DUF58 domain-containing protein [Rhodocyclaceae bacterium]